MTREELRDYVDEQRILNNIPYHVYSALIDGIDTLEQEPSISEIPNNCDLISRKVVLENAFAIYTHECGLVEVVGVDTIKDLPPVKPQTGHWRHYEGMLTCSECGAEFYDDIMEYCGDDVPKCCPDCGAKLSENPAGSKDVQRDAEIKVGDEVITKIGNKGVVIMDVPCEDGSICVWSPKCNRVQMYPVKDLSKTGRHFDQITEVLDKMRGEE